MSCRTTPKDNPAYNIFMIGLFGLSPARRRPRQFALCACLLVFSVSFGNPAAQELPAEWTRKASIEAKQKIDHKWRPRESVVLGEKFKESLQPDARGPYGGLAGSHSKETGFFHTRRDSSGRWWLVDPAGHSFLSVGINAVRPDKSARARRNLRGVWTTEENWAVETSRFLSANGFNCLGAWSNFKAIGASQHPLPYTDVLNFMGRYSMKTKQSKQGTGHRDYPDDLIPVFDPAFEKFCHEEAKQLGTLKDDPWLLGYFSDNEMPFPDDALDRFLRRPASDSGHAAARQWLADNQLDAANPTPEIRARFLHFMAERYFRIAREAIRAHDPNHLYLGTRFHAKVLRSEPVIRAAGKHVDVVSINWYAQWTPDMETMDNWVEWSGKPFLITEFFAKAMDSGLPNTSGAGWIVRTQSDRAAFYQNFVLPLVRHPGCVGWHWFRYMDNDPEDIPSDPSNLDANKGIVDGKFKPYPDFLDGMNLFNQRVYQLRLQAGNETK